MTSAKDDAWLLKPFSDPGLVANYADGPRRFVPGLSDLHRMAGILLAELAPADARVLVLGAGGGLELKALAEAHSGWTFVGVDPAAEMLSLAERTLGPLNARVTFQQGYIDDVSDSAFDAAVCLLTLHFLDPDERRRTEQEIHRRLKPGAPFVAAHSSFPQANGERAAWLSRYAAFAIASGVDPKQAEHARASVDAKLLAVTPEHDHAILEEAGFSNVTPFYAAFTWRGWVAYA
jgi:tRNA (cmo5U34)-methyltransferase